jgi:hypothetical protein
MQVGGHIIGRFVVVQIKDDILLRGFISYMVHSQDGHYIGVTFGLTQVFDYRLGVHVHRFRDFKYQCFKYNFKNLFIFGND